MPSRGVSLRMRAPVQLPPQVLGLNIYMHVHLRLRDSHDHAGWHVSTHAGLGKGTQVSVPMRVRPSAGGHCVSWHEAG